MNVVNVKLDEVMEKQEKDYKRCFGNRMRSKWGLVNEQDLEIILGSCWCHLGGDSITNM